jgi:hypothetical protein
MINLLLKYAYALLNGLSDQEMWPIVGEFQPRVSIYITVEFCPGLKARASTGRFSPQIRYFPDKHPKEPHTFGTDNPDDKGTLNIGSVVHIDQLLTQSLVNELHPSTQNPY